MGLARVHLKPLADGEKIALMDIVGGGYNASGRVFWVKASTATGYKKFFDDHNTVEENTNSVYNTITAAIAAATDGRGDVIYVAEGAYDETVTVNKSKLTIIGLGGRGAAYIEPTTAGAEGMQVTANDVTLINLGVASDDTGDYALNVHGNDATNKLGKRFRAYGCKFEGASGASSVAVLLDGDANYQTADDLFYDCEFAWASVGLQAKASGYGVPTQIFVEYCKFHNITTACINEADANSWFTNLVVRDCVFESQENGTEPTDWVVVDHANSSGIFTRNSFATATNAAGVLTIGAQIMWVANYTEAGVSSARPA